MELHGAQSGYSSFELHGLFTLNLASDSVIFFADLNIIFLRHAKVSGDHSFLQHSLTIGHYISTNTMSTKSLDSNQTTASTTVEKPNVQPVTNINEPPTIQEKYGIEITNTDDPEPEYLQGFRLAIVMFTLCLSTLLAALDIVSSPPLPPFLSCTFSNTWNPGHSRHRHPRHNRPFPPPRRRRLVRRRHLSHRRYYSPHLGEAVQVLPWKNGVSRFCCDLFGWEYYCCRCTK